MLNWIKTITQACERASHVRHKSLAQSNHNVEMGSDFLPSDISTPPPKKLEVNRIFFFFFLFFFFKSITTN